MFPVINRPGTAPFWWQPMNGESAQNVYGHGWWEPVLSPQDHVSLRTKPSKFLTTRCTHHQLCNPGWMRSGAAQVQAGAINPLSAGYLWCTISQAHANSERLPRRRTDKSFPPLKRPRCCKGFMLPVRAATSESLRVCQAKQPLAALIRPGEWLWLFSTVTSVYRTFEN